MARRKCSMRTEVFFTSELYTSEPTMGQNGTLLPSSWAMPRASAVLPVPEPPARKPTLSSQALASPALADWLPLRSLRRGTDSIYRPGGRRMRGSVRSLLPHYDDRSLPLLTGLHGLSRAAPNICERSAVWCGATAHPS